MDDDSDKMPLAPAGGVFGFLYNPDDRTRQMQAEAATRDLSLIHI